jgi:hypothetical protein
MPDDFLSQLGDALRSRGSVGCGGDSRANLALRRAPNGAYLAIYFLGRSVSYWGPLLSILERLAAASQRHPGVVPAVILRSGDRGYVLDAQGIERRRGRWSISAASTSKANYQLNDAGLDGEFASFRGADECADLLMNLVADAPRGPDGLTAAILKASSIRRRSRWWSMPQPNPADHP